MSLFVDSLEDRIDEKQIHRFKIEVQRFCLESMEIPSTDERHLF